MLGVARDITAKRAAEEAYLDSQTLMAAIVTQAADAIDVIDPATLGFVQVNRAGAELLGYTEEEYLQLGLAGIQGNMALEELRQAVQSIQPGHAIVFENQHRRKDGTLIDVSVTANRVVLANRLLVVGIWRDITQLKANERELEAPPPGAGRPGGRTHRRTRGGKAAPKWPPPKHAIQPTRWP